MMDLRKLAPAPFTQVRWGNELYAVDDANGRAVAHFANVADAKQCVLARNALDVMMRRGWHAEHWSDGWGVDATFDGSVDYEDWHKSPFALWLDAKRWPDSFTALVEADKWYKDNVEAKK